MAITDTLHTLGITLPDLAAPAANYSASALSGNQVFISGTLPIKHGEITGKGTVGEDVSTEEAVSIARLCGINILATLRDACEGDLERVRRCVKIGVFVNATSDYTDHPKVANGVSDLMVDVFGDNAGTHARFAVGAGSLPFGVAVEVEALFELR
jgi:enamine deaminase RidA (YjgF/YER057c/UK114 family)